VRAIKYEIDTDYVEFLYIHFPPQIRITNSNQQIDLELPRAQQEGVGYRTLPGAPAGWSTRVFRRGKNSSSELKFAQIQGASFSQGFRGYCGM
jgi:hypothetical protein